MLITIWTYWCFLITFLVFVFFLPINLCLVFLLGNYGKELFVRYNHHVGNLLLFFYGLNKKITGSYPFNHNKPCIYVANHKSYLDVIIIASLVSQKIKYLGKEEVFQWPFIGFFAKNSGQIPVKREDSESRKKAYDMLKESIDLGFSVILFPEGGWRNQDGGSFPNPYGFEKNQLLNEFRNGAFRLAIEKQVPIIPIALINAGDKFPSTSMKLTPGSLHIHVFDLLYANKDHDPLKLNHECYNIILNKLKEYVTI